MSKTKWDPLTESGKFLYKCRLCGEIDASLGGGGPALYAALEVITKGKFGDGQCAKMVSLHNCKSGNLGVTDFVGMGPIRDCGDDPAPSRVAPGEPDPRD